MRTLASFIASLLFLMFIILSLSRMKGIAQLNFSANSLNASPKAIGSLMFTDYLIAFEVLSLVLLGVMIAAIFLIKE